MSVEKAALWIVAAKEDDANLDGLLPVFGGSLLVRSLRTDRIDQASPDERA